MKIVTYPSAEIVASSQYHLVDTFKIPSDGDDHVKIGSFAAKVCYDSNGVDGRPNEDNQRKVIESRHGSVLEHMSVSLYITGISRGLSLELNRHRTFSISQRSTRYTAEEDAAFVLDPYYSTLFLKDNWVHDSIWGSWHIIPHVNEYTVEQELLQAHLESLASSLKDYERQVYLLTELNPNNLSGFELRKWARGKARNVLPHALETRGVYTNNHRGWRWFIESRSDKHAEPEIRRLADCILEVLRGSYPLYYDDFNVISMYDDIPEWAPEYRKI